MAQRSDVTIFISVGLLNLHICRTRRTEIDITLRCCGRFENIKRVRLMMLMLRNGMASSKVSQS